MNKKHKPVLQLEGLTVGYKTTGKQQVVTTKDINVSLKAGEFVCLLGPNGAGKSTLMRTISGMQSPLSGEVTLDGENIYSIPSRELAKKLSVVLTERIDGGLLSAYEVAALGRFPYTSWSGTLAKKDHEVVHWALTMAGAAELAHRPINELSDGERQKILLAKALAQEPKIMILDEITAFMDLPRRVDAMRLLRRLARETNCSVILSTHDLDLAMRSADQVWLLPKGGDLIVGAPEGLVLNGSFEKAFASEGVTFDRQSGSFQIHAQPEHLVQLKGEGEAYLWTKRALERCGIKVSSFNQPSEWLIEVAENNKKYSWKITTYEGQEYAFSSLETMLSQINDLLKVAKV